MNCKTPYGVEVFKVKAVDNGGYFGVLAVNWDSMNEASILLDLTLIGVSPAQYYSCNVTSMWFPSVSTVVTNGLYQVTKIPPHGNAALKINCYRPLNTNYADIKREEELFLQQE